MHAEGPRGERLRHGAGWGEEGRARSRALVEDEPLERPGEAGTHCPALSPSPPESLHEKMLPILKRHFFIILLTLKFTQ